VTRISCSARRRARRIPTGTSSRAAFTRRSTAPACRARPFHSLRHTHASLWIKDGGDVITLSKRLGHANPQITMSVYADEIEESADHSIRRAHVNALFEGTRMTALMAAPDDHNRPHAASTEAEIVPLTSRDAA
jgi:integrase